MASNPEAKLTLKIRKALEAEGAYVFKVHGGRFSAGIPDLVGCMDGQFFGFEVKLPGRTNTVTKLQQANLTRIEEAGGVAAVVTTVDEALEKLPDLA
jgi:hypothetical protein